LKDLVSSGFMFVMHYIMLCLTNLIMKILYVTEGKFYLKYKTTT